MSSCDQDYAAETARLNAIDAGYFEMNCVGGISRTEIYLQMIGPSDSGMLFCAATTDGDGTCWPPAKAGTFAVRHCPELFNNFLLDNQSYCSRYCHPNATWNPRSNYSNCTIIGSLKFQDPRFICCFVGYVISATAIIISLVTLLHFRSLRTVRNKIHRHFMLSLLIRALIWFASITLASEQMISLEGVMATMRVFILLAVYNWMLVEGVHLLGILFWTLKFKQLETVTYCIVGWGLPAILALYWATTKIIKGGSVDDWRQLDFNSPESVVVIVAILLMLGVNLVITAITLFVLTRKTHTRLRNRPLSGFCESSKSRKSLVLKKLPTSRSLTHPDQGQYEGVEHHIEDPRTSVSEPAGLSVQDSNRLDDDLRQKGGGSSSERSGSSALSLVKEISKGSPASDGYLHYGRCGRSVSRRSSQLTSFPSQRNRVVQRKVRVQSASLNLIEAWKATKEILILMPLLGYPQLIVLLPYSVQHEEFFEYVSAVIISTQGFFVSLIYFYCNSQVQRLFKNRFARWRSSGNWRSVRRNNTGTLPLTVTSATGIDVGEQKQES